MQELAPWERQPKETAKAWEAFQVYRDMGANRTLRAAAEQLGKGEPGLQKWSSRWSWVERVRAWDDEQDRIRARHDERLAKEAAEAEAKAVKKMLVRHTALAEAMTRKVGEDLAAMIQPKCQTCGAGANRLTPADMSKWITVAGRLERVSRGLPPDGDRGPLVQVNNTNVVINVSPITLIEDPQARALNAQLLRRLAAVDREDRDAARLAAPGRRRR